MARSLVARGLLARGRQARGPLCGKRAKRESFVLRTYVVGEMGVRELHID